eukprot:CAMPEP_0170500602 /NCGR_PEP_ID=MMETSP0208-20121228/35401_1 /TAXON_ID=197538 /ORGANISM="Strombidium inclinatum, Strain S3" /LENGTH=73 /DNA_ID=CAMNT_0010778713 /DNA_START=954 /DNA_END=1172 /DNA_ORIENTATION=+
MYPIDADLENEIRDVFKRDKKFVHDDNELITSVEMLGRSGKRNSRTDQQTTSGMKNSEHGLIRAKTKKKSVYH